MISAIGIGVTLMTDSFWAVSLRALRVVYWWLQQLWWFYAGAAIAGENISVSLTCPHSSIWSFVMLCGFSLAAAAIYLDRKAEDRLASKAVPDTSGKPVSLPRDHVHPKTWTNDLKT